MWRLTVVGNTGKSFTKDFHTREEALVHIDDLTANIVTILLQWIND